MNIWTSVLLGLLVVLLLGVCFLLALLLQRQNALLARVHNQEKAAAQTSASAASQAQAHFRVVSEQLAALNKDQIENGTLMDRLGSQMETMNKVMTNTKLRGSWGEYQMEHLIRAYAGDNPYVYEVQYHLENGKIADGVFHLPGSSQLLCIDSKFPMENYLKMDEYPEDQAYYQKEFRKNMKKHIDDVSEKYITPQTTDMALLFIPSEAIYQFVCGSQSDMLHYALKKHVLLVSPTTLAGVVFSLLASSKDYYRAQNMAHIEKELARLQDDFTSLYARMEKADRQMASAIKAQSELHQSLGRTIHNIEDVLSGKEAVLHGTERHRSAAPETQSQPLSGAQRQTGQTGF